MPDDATVRVTSPREDLAAMFAIRAAEVGMTVHRTRSADVPAVLGRLFVQLGIKAAAVTDALVGIGGRLSPGVILTPWSQLSGIESLYEMDAGLSEVQAAIAETGTLVCWSGPGRGRGVSLVPPIHIAVVRRSDLVPDLVDYFARHAGQGPEHLPSSVVFITGPSKTADIEGILITGVHGPRAVHILLVEDA